LTIKNIFND